MELFKISCETCAARLRVSHVSAIGQVAACPKCGNMVRISPPDGWQMPDEVKQQLESQRAAATSADSTSGDFDDVHNILASSDSTRSGGRSTGDRHHGDPPTRNPRSGKTQPQRAAPQPRKTKSTVGSTVAPHQQVARDEVILPNEQWTAAATQKRRKALMIIAGAAGLLIIVTVIVVAIVARSPISSTVATTEPNPPVSDASDPDEPVTDSDAAANVGNDAVEIAKDQQPKPDGQGSEKVDTPALDVDPALDTAATTDAAEDQDSSLAGAAKDRENASDNAMTDTTTGDSSAVGSGAPNLPDVSPDANRQLDAIINPKSPKPLEPTDFGTISDLLEESGMSISEINDLAAAYRERQLIGQSKYFIEKPDPLEPKVFEGLQYPCAGIQYIDKPLLIVLHDISLISGVPISIDANSIQFLGVDVGKQLSIKAEDTTFGSVVNEIVAADDFKLVLQYGGDQGALLIAQALLQDSGDSSLRITLPNLESKDVEAVQQFVLLVKSMIAPAVWAGEDAPGTIEIHEDHLEVSAPPLVRRRVQAFVEKWNAGKAIAEGNDDASGVLTTLLEKAEPTMSSTFQVNSIFPMPMETYLAKIQLLTGKNVIVDWTSLLAEEWNPLTMLPPNIVEKDLRHFLQHVCRAMELTYRVVDENTVQITTFTTASQQADFEAYSCAKILAGKLSHKQLVELLQQALGLEIKSQPNLRVFLDAESQCLFVVAPQFVHRQIKAILDRLQ